jgi:hypothetical protein
MSGESTRDVAGNGNRRKTARGWIAVSAAVCALGRIAPALISHAWAAPAYLRLFVVGIASASIYLPAVALLGFTGNERATLRNALTHGT